MPIQLANVTGLARGTQQERITHIKSGIAENKTTASAQSDLESLRLLLENRNGNRSLKLFRSTQEAGGVEFSTKFWKFRGRGELTGEALKSLFEKAGSDSTKLDAYLAERGDKALKVKDVRSILREVAAATAETQRDAIHAAGIRVDFGEDAANLPAGTFGVTHEARIDGRADHVFKELKNGVPVTLDQQNPAKLSRLNNEVVSAFLKSDIPNVVKPTHFTVQEVKSDGTQAHHTVPGGKVFKNWAARHLAEGSTLHISGIVMPKAQGVSGNAAWNELAQDDLAHIADQGLRTLDSMASHGFLHGDLKEDNAFYDPATKKLAFIDLGGMSKMSKHAAPNQRGVIDFPYSPGRVLPKVGQHATVGCEQDVFSLGSMLLRTSMESRGVAGGAIEYANTRASNRAEARELSDLDDSVENDQEQDIDQKQYYVDLVDYLRQNGGASPVEEFALGCITRSMDQQEPVTQANRSEFFAPLKMLHAQHFPLQASSQTDRGETIEGYPLHSSVGLGEAQRTDLARELTDFKDITYSPEGAGNKGGLPTAFLADIGRSDFVLQPARGGPATSLGFSTFGRVTKNDQEVDRLAGDWNAFFHKEFPADPALATRWAKTAAIFMCQRTTASDSGVRYLNGFFVNGLDSEKQDTKYSFQLEPGGRSALIHYESSASLTSISQGVNGELQPLTMEDAAVVRRHGLDSARSRSNEAITLRVALKSPGDLPASPNQAIAENIGVEVLASTKSHDLARFSNAASREQAASRLEARDQHAQGQSNEIISDNEGEALLEKKALDMIPSGSEQENRLNRYLAQKERPNLDTMAQEI